MFSVPVRSEMSDRRTPSRLVGRKIPPFRSGAGLGSVSVGTWELWRLMTAGVHTKSMPSNGVKGLFACGSASPDPIVSNFGGRFFHLNGVTSVIGTTRRAGGHKPMLLASMKGYFGLISGSDPGEAVLTGFELPKSWVLEFVMHSVSTPTPTTSYPMTPIAIIQSCFSTR